MNEKSDKDILSDSLIAAIFKTRIMSQVILEDYSTTIAKLEGVPEKEVVDRLRERMAKVIQEVKAEFPMLNFDGNNYFQ